MTDPVFLSEPEPETVLEPVHNVPEQLQETTKHQTTAQTWDFTVFRPLIKFAIFFLFF